MILSTCRKPLCSFAGKKSTSSPMLYWRYCKDMQTYFGYFGHICMHTPKMISTCTRLWCLSVCKKTSFIIHFFLEILHFKESCNLIGWQHRELEFCQIWDWWWNINNNISFHFRLSSRKTNDKFFLKIQKEPILGPFWALFTQIWPKMNFPAKKSSVTF